MSAVAQRRLSVTPAFGWRWAVGFLLLAAAGLRFAGLDQSFWYDEAVTTSVIHFGWVHGLLHQIATTESTPPLYYALVKAWGAVFGVSEVGLRSFSAVAGTAAVGVVYLLAAEVSTRRVGVIAASLAAVNPALIWYSQEARCYSLLVLLSALSVLFVLRARRNSDTAALWCWSASSALALLTHYYAVFLVGAEAVWLVWDARAEQTLWRRRLLACVPLVLVELAVLPLLIHQLDVGSSSWINTLPVEQRLGQVVFEALTFNAGLVVAVLSISPGGGYAVTAMSAVLLGLWGLLRADPRNRVRAGSLAALSTGVLLVPLALAFVGFGGFYDRNLLGISLPLIVVLAIGYSALDTRLALLGLVVICGVSIVTDVRMTSDWRLQRPPWRTVAASLTPRTESRVVLLTPGWQLPVLAYYDRGLTPLPGAATVSQLDVIAYNTDVYLLPGRIGPFRVTERRQDGQLAFASFTAPRPTAVTASLLAANQLDRPGMRPLLDPAGPRIVGP